MGPSIRALREARGMTTEELAAAAGVNTELLARIERGQTSLKIDAAVRIAAALGVPTRELTASAQATAAGS
jgi:transcriptional regulator with XRE-family HTH domain